MIGGKSKDVKECRRVTEPQTSFIISVYLEKNNCLLWYVCVLSPSYPVGEELIHFTLSSLHLPPSVPPSSLPSLHWGIASMPGEWLKELVRLSSQGFHLVILPLGIHTTLSPPESACLNTEGDFPLSFSLSHSPTHFPGSHFSVCLSTLYGSLSTLFLLIPFYAAFSTLSVPVPPPPPPFNSGLFDSVRISNCVRADAVSC